MTRSNQKSATTQSQPGKSTAPAPSDEKKVYSSIEVTARGYINEIVEQPSYSSASGKSEPLLFVRCSLMMGEDETGTKRYQPVSVLAGRKVRPVVERLLQASWEDDQQRPHHPFTGLIVDLKISSVVFDIFETEDKTGVNFNGFLSDIVI